MKFYFCLFFLALAQVEQYILAQATFILGYSFLLIIIHSEKSFKILMASSLIPWHFFILKTKKKEGEYKEWMKKKKI